MRPYRYVIEGRENARHVHFCDTAKAVRAKLAEIRAADPDTPVKVMAIRAPDVPRFDGQMGGDHERDYQAEMGWRETHDELLDRLHL